MKGSRRMLSKEEAREVQQQLGGATARRSTAAAPGWRQDHHVVLLDAVAQERLTTVLREDSCYLREHGIMDYSLLLGVRHRRYKIGEAPVGIAGHLRSSGNYSNCELSDDQLPGMVASGNSSRAFSVSAPDSSVEVGHSSAAGSNAAGSGAASSSLAGSGRVSGRVSGSQGQCSRRLETAVQALPARAVQRGALQLHSRPAFGRTSEAGRARKAGARARCGSTRSSSQGREAAQEQCVCDGWGWNWHFCERWQAAGEADGCSAAAPGEKCACRGWAYDASACAEEEDCCA